ncbi:MAG: DUF4337 domain-containing protein [Acidobacteriota bacterium]
MLLLPVAIIYRKGIRRKWRVWLKRIRKSGLTILALTTVILAVCATLSTFKGGNFSTRSVMSQSQAANQWAYYQAKSVNGYLYEAQKEKLELELKAMGPGASRSAAEEYEKKITSYSGKIKKYEDEKAAIKSSAESLEKIRDDAQRHTGIFGMAVIFLQLAILLSSIAALMKKKPLWLLGCLVGVCGIVYFANGFILFFR